MFNPFNIDIPRALRPRWDEAHKTFETKREERKSMTKEDRERLDEESRGIFKKLKLED